MKERLISLIKPFADACYHLVNAVSPGWALILFVALLLLLALWVIGLKQEKRREDGTGNYSWWEDLRTSAVAIILVQALIYVVLR